MNTKRAAAWSFLVAVDLLIAGCGASTPPVSTDVSITALATDHTLTPSENPAATLMPPHRSLITPVTQETMTVTVYFSQDGQEDCSAVEPIERVVPASTDTATAALNQLFAGPTEAERGKGYNSWFSDETASILLSLHLDGSKAYVNLKDIRPIIPGANSSCGSQMFFAQIEATLKNITPVDRVFYAIEGDPVAFYEWIQIGCDPALNNCDPAPFAAP